ncbi:hypothetical protein I6F26_31890 [Ensifer sp. IC3342]|nr:hypothetical protein [Ensifer sp. IC3342]
MPALFDIRGVCKSNLDRAIVEQFGMSVTREFVHFVASCPCEGDHGRAVAEIEARLHRTQGDLAMTVGPDSDCGGLDQVEIIPILQSGLDDSPAANQAAIQHRVHDSTAISFGNRTRS